MANESDHTVVAIDPHAPPPIGDPVRVALGPYAHGGTGLGHLWVTGIGEDPLSRLDLS